MTRDALRRLVVTTRHLPLLERAYEIVFDRLVARTLSRIHVPDGVALYERRRRGRRVFEAGISDVDLLAILTNAPDAPAALDRCIALDRVVASARTLVPLVRDVHAFTEEEYAVLARLGSSLVAVTHAVPLGRGAPRPLPAITEGTACARVAALELAHFTTLRAARQLLEESEPLASALATHALAKSSVGGPRVAPGGAFEAVASALGRLDALHDRPRGEAAPPSSIVHPGVASRRDAVERWSEGLLELPALRSVALLADSPGESDVRLALVLDPSDASAARTLAAIARHVQRHAPPAIAVGAGPMRLHLLTPSVLNRTWPQTDPSLEPLLRGAAVAFGEPLPSARPERATIARNLAIGSILASSALRERASRPPTPATIRRALAIANGVLPAIECFVDERPLAGEARETGVGPDVVARTLARLHEATERVVPRLVELARPIVSDEAPISGS